MHLLAAKPGSDFRRQRRRRSRPDAGRDRHSVVRRYASWPAWPRRRRGCGPDAPSLRLANLLQLGHNLSVDLYLEQGRPACPAGDPAPARRRRATGPMASSSSPHSAASAASPLRRLPGDDQPDAGADGSSPRCRPRRRIASGAIASKAASKTPRNLLRFAATLIGREGGWREPMPLLRAGLYWPGRELPSYEDLAAPLEAGSPGRRRSSSTGRCSRPGICAVIDALIAALDARGPRCAAPLCHEPQGGRGRRSRRGDDRAREARGHPERHGLCPFLARCRADGHALRWRGCAGAAGRLLRRQRSGMARRQPGPVGRAISPCRWPCRKSTGASCRAPSASRREARFDPATAMLDRRLSAGPRPHRLRGRAGGALGAAARRRRRPSGGSR